MNNDNNDSMLYFYQSASGDVVDEERAVVRQEDTLPVDGGTVAVPTVNILYYFHTSTRYIARI